MVITFARDLNVNPIINADAVEAVFGAIFLDSDFGMINQVILDLYRERLNNIKPSDSLKDPKTRLQEYLQKRGKSLPKYELIKTIGKDHNAVFVVNCILEDPLMQCEQSAKSIKCAEQMCAEIMLDSLKQS